MVTTSAEENITRHGEPRTAKQRRHNQAVELGEAAGRDLPRIWEGPAKTVENVFVRVTPSIPLIGGSIPTRATYLMAAWASLLLLVASIIWIWAALTGLPIEARRDRVDWLLVPGVLVIVWGFVYFGGRAILAAAIRRRVNRLSGLTDVACLAALQVVEERQVAAREHTPGRSSRSHLGAAPFPQPYGVSATGAVELMVDWMRFLGAGDAHVSDSTTGVDAEPSAYVVRASAGDSPVGVEAMRELTGIASVTGRRALYLSAAKYLDEATEFAGQAKIALFQFEPRQGTMSGANGDGEALLSPDSKRKRNTS